jgi:hypothetical protein
MDTQLHNLDVIVLFDKSAELKIDINYFKHIKILQTDITKTSYDKKVLLCIFLILEKI